MEDKTLKSFSSEKVQLPDDSLQNPEVSLVRSVTSAGRQFLHRPFTMQLAGTEDVTFEVYKSSSRPLLHSVETPLFRAAGYSAVTVRDSGKATKALITVFLKNIDVQRFQSLQKNAVQLPTEQTISEDELETTSEDLSLGSQMVPPSRQQSAQWAKDTLMATGKYSTEQIEDLGEKQSKDLAEQAVAGARQFLTEQNYDQQTIDDADRNGHVVWLAVTASKDIGILDAYKKVLELQPALANHPDLQNVIQKCTAQYLQKIVENPQQAELYTAVQAKAAGMLSETDPDNNLLVFADSSGQIHMTVWSSYQLEPSKEEGGIGKGTFGVAQKLRIIGKETLGGANTVVMKAALPMAQARADVANEAKLLFEIHADGIKEGIQLPPHAVLSVNPPIKDREGKDVYGYIQPLYSGDLTNLHAGELSREQGLEMCRQLLSGAAELERQRIISGDIKSGNIFYNAAESNKYYLADLGGARRLPVLEAVTDNTELTLNPAHTKPLVCFDDVMEYAKVGMSATARAAKASAIPGRRVRKQEQETASLSNEERFNKFVELENRRDVYALGATLIANLGRKPGEPLNEVIFETNGIGYSTGTLSKNGQEALENIAAVYGDEVADLLKSMVNPAYSERPDRTTAYQRLTAIMSK